jgi:hypothetical protein
VSDIPKARELLQSALDDLNLDWPLGLCRSALVDLRDKIRDALDLMDRHYVKERAPGRRKPLTDDQKMDVVQFYNDHPAAPLERMAERYNVSIGRISEALRGL